VSIRGPKSCRGYIYLLITYTIENILPRCLRCFLITRFLMTRFLLRCLLPAIMKRYFAFTFCKLTFSSTLALNSLSSSTNSVTRLIYITFHVATYRLLNTFFKAETFKVFPLLTSPKMLSPVRNAIGANDFSIRSILRQRLPIIFPNPCPR